MVSEVQRVIQLVQSVYRDTLPQVLSDAVKSNSLKQIGDNQQNVKPEDATFSGMIEQDNRPSTHQPKHKT